MIERSLMQHGRKIKLEQRTKAESDIAVAAASILARERFIDWLDKTGREYQVVLPRGASEQVKKVARELVSAHSAEALDQLAKTHFKTASEVAPERFTAKTRE
jgi:ribonuclease HIII